MNFCVIYLVIHYFVDKSNFKVGVLQKFVDVFKLVLFLICYFSVEIYNDRIRLRPGRPLALSEPEPTQPFGIPLSEPT